jgi:hypothetical protein
VTRARALLAALCAAPLLAVGGAPARAADLTSTEALDRIAPAIVSINAVFHVKLSFQGQNFIDQELPAPGLGVVVDPSGLIAVGDIGHLTRALEQGGEGFSMSLTPRSLKVTFGGDPKEHEAVLVVRDSALGVAFLQVLDLGDRRLAAIDFTKGGEGPRIGQDLIGVRRLGRGFDYAPEALRLSVGQEITQPRRMWGVRGDFEEHGLPVFDRAGAPVGLVTFQLGSEGIDMQAMMAGATPGRLCILPLDVIQRLIEQARKRVPEAVQKARSAKEAAPATEGAAMDDAAMDGGGMDGGGMDDAGMDGGGMDGGGAAMDGAGMEGPAPPEKGPAPPT